MEVFVRGRGARLDEGVKEQVEEKLGRLNRLDGRIDRIDVEVTFESRGRIHHGHLVEASCRSGRRTYRAHADGEDVTAAIDRLVERLKRQISDHHQRRGNRVAGVPGKVQSARMGPNEVEPPVET